MPDSWASVCLLTQAVGIMLTLVTAASGMKNAVSGGEVPYQFADDTGKSCKLDVAFILLSVTSNFQSN